LKIRGGTVEMISVLKNLPVPAFSEVSLSSENETVSRPSSVYLWGKAYDVDFAGCQDYNA